VRLDCCRAANRQHRVVDFDVNHASRLWALAGKDGLSHVDAAGDSLASDYRLYQHGGVRVTAGKNGTEIRWLAQSPCIASLFVVLGWLPEATVPIALRFNASGWFEEFYDDAGKAKRRIEEIIARSDRHFFVRTFVEEVDLSRKVVASQLMDILESPETAEIYSVVCEYNKYNDRFTVERIGARSPIARFYGTFTNSYPCTVMSYGDRVSAGYRAALSTGRPRVDHVLAAFRLPDNEVHWVPYHRLILPVAGEGQGERVQVISQIAPVAFKVI